MKEKNVTKIYKTNTCPLCNNDNACLNSCASEVTDESSHIKKACWCMDPHIDFSEMLLKQVPVDAKNKSCICQACALADPITK